MMLRFGEGEVVCRFCCIHFITMVGVRGSVVHCKHNKSQDYLFLLYGYIMFAAHLTTGWTDGISKVRWELALYNFRLAGSSFVI